MRPRAIGMSIATTLMVAACTSGHGAARPEATSTTTTTSTPSTTTTVPPFVPQPVAWSACGGRLRCATVTVPRDYGAPDGPTIDLAINELPARQPDERIGVLLVNPGGPGGSGLDFVAKGVRLGDTILDRFDVVGFDPRGVGKSTKLDCATDELAMFQRLDSAPDTPEEQTQLEASAMAVASSCGAAAGDYLPHLGTDDVVRDIDTIRQALGAEQINYLGISYGTLLGLRYAHLFPQRARAIALDGVVDPTQSFVDFLEQQTIAFDKEITRFLDAGGVTGQYDELAQRLEAGSIPAGRGRTLGPSELAVAALVPTYTTGLASSFYRGLTSALNGDGTTLRNVADAYYLSVEVPLYMAVECTDTPHPVGAAAYRDFANKLEALSPRVGGAVANELLPCAFWPTAVHDISGPIVAPESPPILVVGNTDDAATPYQQAVTVASTLAHGHLLTLDSAGHAAYGRSNCVLDAETAYFVSLTVPSDGATCSD